MVLTNRRFSVLLYDFMGHSHILLATLRALGSVRGARVHLLADRALEPSRFSRHRSSFRLIPPEEKDPVRLETILRTVRQKGIDVLLPCGEEAVRFSSETKADLSAASALPPIPSREVFELTRDKWRFTSYLAEHGIPAPPTRLLTSADQVPDILRELNLPFIIKPRIGAGGHGIRKVNSPDEMEMIAQDPSVTRQDHILQEFVPGNDYGCSLLADSGRILAHTGQRWIIPAGAPFAAAAGNFFEPVDALFNPVARIAELMNWSGVANIDARLDSRDGTFKIFEWNPRFWRSVLGSVHAGVNFPYLACLAALGCSIAQPTVRHCRYIHENRIALRLFLSQQEEPGGGKVHLSETVLPHVALDPLADAALLLPFHN